MYSKSFFPIVLYPLHLFVNKQFGIIYIKYIIKIFCFNGQIAIRFEFAIQIYSRGVIYYACPDIYLFIVLLEQPI